jgi:L-lactate dehydrogenase complex protein LldF
MTPQFLGPLRAKDLPLASTLCGACAEVCPVRIPLPELLLALRRRIVEQQGHSGWERALIKGWAACQTSPGCYRISLELARLGQDVFPGLFPPGTNLPGKNFHRIWKDEYQD